MGQIHFMQTMAPIETLRNYRDNFQNILFQSVIFGNHDKTHLNKSNLRLILFWETSLMVTSGSSLRSGSQPLSFGQCHGGSTPGHGVTVSRKIGFRGFKRTHWIRCRNVTILNIYIYVYKYISIYTEHIACNIIGRFWKWVVAPKYEL